MPLDKTSQLDKLSRLDRLDPLVSPLSKAVAGVIRPGPVEDALHGTWLGHPLHPALAQLPIGCFVSATVLDLLGERTAAGKLGALGMASATPAALAGATDWSHSNPGTQRTGLVHALLNSAALLAWGSSLLRRRRGGGALLGALGTSLLGASASVGGHIAYRQGLGANADTDITGPTDWTDAGEDDLVTDRPTLRTVAGTQVLLVRTEDGIQALADRCSHQSGPLHEGTVHDGCVTCPWHGSTFRLSDGHVEHGPSTHPQPAFEVRRAAGRLEVRLRG
jgi:nitrite reductase/ring-hydroxylating ferredoxin subunit/uncharacterized membrane protein